MTPVASTFGGTKSFCENTLFLCSSLGITQRGRQGTHFPRNANASCHTPRVVTFQKLLQTFPHVALIFSLLSQHPTLLNIAPLKPRN